MTEPTPGPWRPHEQNRVYGPNDEVVAKVYRAEDVPLIAKARHLPELIAVLKIVRPMVEDYADYHESFGILNQLDAALALVQETDND